MHRLCTNATPFSELCVLWSPEEDTGANPPQDQGQLHSTLIWVGASLGGTISLTAQIDPELIVVQHQLPKFWDDKHGPSCLAFVYHYNVSDKTLDPLALPPKHKMKPLAKNICFCSLSVICSHLLLLRIFFFFFLFFGGGIQGLI